MTNPTSREPENDVEDMLTPTEKADTPPRDPDGEPCPCCSSEDEPAEGCICPAWCPNA
jgi:hypothetical protein